MSESKQRITPTLVSPLPCEVPTKEKPKRKYTKRKTIVIDNVNAPPPITDAPPEKKKRKYVRRKKPDTTLATADATPSEKTPPADSTVDPPKPKRKYVRRKKPDVVLPQDLSPPKLERCPIEALEEALLTAVGATA